MSPITRPKVIRRPSRAVDSEQTDSKRDSKIFAVHKLRALQSKLDILQRSVSAKGVMHAPEISVISSPDMNQPLPRKDSTATANTILPTKKFACICFGRECNIM